jgi:LacI family transcriptional regulator
MITIKEVAEEAGVSLGTVSRVINNHPTVSADNLEKVNKAIQKLGYIVKQSKGSNQLKNVGLIFLGIDRTLVTLPIISEGIHAVQERLNENEINTFIADIPDLKKIPKFIEQNNVDGLILKGPLSSPLPTVGNNQLCDLLRVLPTVWILGRPENSWQDHCGPDNYEIGRLAANYIRSKKHSQIAVINLQPNNLMLNERISSFIWNSKLLGNSVDYIFSKVAKSSTFPISNDSNLENMEKAVDDMLKSKLPYTAVFVPSDTMANLFYTVCRKKGLKVGKDICIVSCNNERSMISQLEPSLTTININIKELSYRAVDQLIWRAENQSINSMFSISVFPEIVIGDSI